MKPITDDMSQNLMLRNCVENQPQLVFQTRLSSPDDFLRIASHEVMKSINCHIPDLSRVAFDVFLQLYDIRCKFHMSRDIERKMFLALQTFNYDELLFFN